MEKVVTISEDTLAAVKSAIEKAGKAISHCLMTGSKAAITMELAATIRSAREKLGEVK